MKRMLFAMVVVFSLFFFAEAFADDLYVDPNSSGSILMAGADAPRNVSSSIACKQGCQERSELCKKNCNMDNRKCQENSDRAENSIYACGKAYSECKDNCHQELLKCIRSCAKL